MENFARRLYHWLPLSLKHKTALRKFLSVHFSRFVFRNSKAGFSAKEYYLGQLLDDSASVKQLIELIVSHYKIAQWKSSSPLVSIIIPVHNHIDFTVRCLLSIAEAKTVAQYEIIVADDASNDKTPELFNGMDVIYSSRSEENIGFLRTCNRVAEIATGKYLVLLNNDTVVQDGWLDALLETFVDFPNAGLVGSKLIYPDGRLQEAGGIIWKNGIGRNYGWGDDPQKPEYNYLREVDYCSGACIMIPRILWKQVGGFDEMFSPAYYEDTDLAFQVREAGYKVYYQPASEVMHFEGISSGTNLDSGVKRHQGMNRHRFVQKWKDTLTQHQDNTSTDEHIFRNRYSRARILYIDSTSPAPDRDAGSIVTFQYLYILKQLGFEVSFIPASELSYRDPYTKELQRKGIECLYYPYIKSVDKFIKIYGHHYNLVFVSRFAIASQYLDVILRYMPHAKIVFNTIDLHFLREERAAQTIGKGLERIDEIRNQELEMIKKADHTIVVSETETSILYNFLPDAQVSVIPIPGKIFGSSQGYEKRHDIVFIGGYHHSPNTDAVEYFIKEIWPLICERLPGVRFIVAGSNMPSDFSKWVSENIILQGYVDNLGDLFDSCKLSVAPLRFGSGVKGKIITSLGYGVPCVATSIATEGMGLIAGHHILQADSPKDFANAVVDAYTNPQLWQELSDNGLAAVKEKNSIDVVEEKLATMLKSLGFYDA